MLLNVPRIAAAVPSVLMFDAADPRLCDLALAMCGNALVPDAMLEGLVAERMDYTTLRNLIAQAWEASLGELFAFEVLSVHLVVSLPREGDCFVEGDRDECMAHVVCGQPEWIDAEPAIQLLEAHQPRLGARALELIDCVLARLGIPFTPSGATWMASMCYWYGEADETVALEEADEDYAAEVPRRADLFGAMPEWVYDFKPTAREREHRQRFVAARSAPATIRRLVTALEALRTVYAAVRGDLLPPPEEFEYYEPAAVLTWGDNESLTRIFDDHWQCGAEAESAPFALGESAPIDAAAISKMLGRIRNTGRVFKALDAVLVELAAHDARRR